MPTGADPSAPPENERRSLHQRTCPRQSAKKNAKKARRALWPGRPLVC